MKIPELDLPHVMLATGEDAQLARAVEAGLYAHHLLEEGRLDPLLPAVVALGRRAAERFAWVGIRMALKYARRTAYLSGLPEDELFQDGCVAVGEAIRRYDHARGIRFSTFVHEYLMRELADGGRHWIGRPTVSRADRRAARMAVRAMDARGLADSESAVDTVVTAMGLSPTAARRGRIRHVSLDVALESTGLAHLSYEPCHGQGLDFLTLLVPRHRRLLQLRFGLTGQARTLAEIAQIMQASPSTVSRWEREALEAARLLLAGERTTAAAAYSEAAAAVG
ncbi:sigma-70 family RNA polymerase sigma factor [Tessaracoccus sp. ZS01]|uniref:sigma-70 family RNA polymerase sigma factor n=1 Tax=Tessaracoccus sp. ZS01 TaxID=1906324 RepID=UPI001180F013|nr:sigma factor-like helix-turn-helix DNA-binding protein [Tessaracoccus sp. ZS01]